MYATNLPDLDLPCGRNFSFRDIIECGETWETERIENTPIQPKTYDAIRALCKEVLDPVFAEFGEVNLTYGFASGALTRKIDGRIAPNLDQHAGYELNSRGNPICDRLGMAADFTVPGNSSRELAHWVYENCNFDRIYFYEDDRPIHVSVGPDNSKQLVHMKMGPSGKRVPGVRAEGRM